MIIAARSVSQVVTHMGVAFAVMYALTGSVAFGGLAALVEPIVNVALLPLHKKFWTQLRQDRVAWQIPYWIGAEKISQVGMHMAVAFGVMYWATGSLAFGGLAAILEPVCNVIVLPFHDRAWERIGQRLERSQTLGRAGKIIYS